MAEPSTLGPATEARIFAAFSTACILTAEAAADLIGVDPGTLSEMTDQGVILAVRRGKRRAYTEGDIRTYLTQGDALPRSLRSPRVNVPTPARVVPFTQRKARAK